jgi:hypothetical protein
MTSAAGRGNTSASMLGSSSGMTSGRGWRQYQAGSHAPPELTGMSPTRAPPPPSAPASGGLGVLTVRLAESADAPPASVASCTASDRPPESAVAPAGAALSAEPMESAAESAAAPAVDPASGTWNPSAPVSPDWPAA